MTLNMEEIRKIVIENNYAKQCFNTDYNNNVFSRDNITNGPNSEFRDLRVTERANSSIR
ncbi:MAG: hypothetical protein PV340_01635 [Wolbachia sp.]|nr:hypothetical protein [Wolbachia sp.]MDD9336310.1 hypothetical protein [Wolbachia sp.]